MTKKASRITSVEDVWPGSKEDEMKGDGYVGRLLACLFARLLFDRGDS